MRIWDFARGRMVGAALDAGIGNVIRFTPNMEEVLTVGDGYSSVRVWRTPWLARGGSLRALALEAAVKTGLRINRIGLPERIPAAEHQALLERWWKARGTAPESAR